MESFGASGNAITYENIAHYYFSVVSEYFEECLQIMLPSFSDFILDKKTISC
jgi:predicted Zn-dependent peptidase